MTGAVAWTHQIVEGSSDPFAIPPRPSPEPEAAIQFDQMRGRLWTYRVTIGGPDAVRVIGFIRWSTDDQWIARTLGSATAAASIRKFTDRAKAASWLQRRLIGGRC
ncbi:MAG: hypothetical protein ACJ8AI_06360 [Rhodopila sp.]